MHLDIYIYGPPSVFISQIIHEKNNSERFLQYLYVCPYAMHKVCGCLHIIFNLDIVLGQVVRVHEHEAVVKNLFCSPFHLYTKSRTSSPEGFMVLQLYVLFTYIR